MSGTAYISGVISGLDTDEILSKLEALAKAPVLRLEAQKATLSAQLSAWQTVNSRLLALKEKAAALAAYTGFSAMTAASSNESLVKATASGNPVPGSYSFIVQSLAAAHRVGSQGFANDTSLVGSGTVTITAGTDAPVEIQVEDLTLAGLRDAINHSDAAVDAFIVSDGSAGTPYRLVVTSERTGTAGAMTIEVNLSGGTAPAFSDLQAAADAVISMGGDLTITRGSNVITDLIPGVTLELLGANPSSSVTVSAVSDTASIKQLVADFVTRYNDLISYIETQWNYDSETNQGGTLFGALTLHQIQSDLVSRISNPVSGLSSGLSLLSQVGITLGTNGRLSLNEATLETALKDNLEGVMKLFSRYGEASNADVVFVSATSDTKPSGETGYAVEITQAAAQARVTGGAAQSDPLAADEVLTINGVNISLTTGMTQAEVISAINAKSAQTGVTASATGADGSGSGQYLTLKSVGYGSNTEVTAISDQSNGGAGSSGIGNVLVSESDPGGESSTGTGAAGQDVAGTINGEAAEGSGQVLVSTAGDAEGLRLLIRAAAAGSYGTVDYTEGAGAKVDGLLAFLTEEENGSVKVSQKTLEERIEDLDENITKMNETVAREQERLRRQFNAMEQALATLQSQSTFLSSQLSQIQNNWRTAG
jgi:flagellar hook-associated protein 2